ncbi:MAG: twin-arginine translocase TatA/TatE family subunit [Bergeyella zoohelcum]|nr:twin-arginine translocase TatA/TatE family subunit [Bergeyella zoohelcum]
MELGFMEIVVVALVIIVLFGPDKLPSIARDLGTGVRKMRGAVEDIKTEIMKEADNPVSEIKKEIERVKESAKEFNPLSDVKKEIDDVKNSMNLDNTQKTNVIETPKPADNNEYEGPVSR